MSALSIELDKTALIIVDLQNDFITGSLRVDIAPAKQDPMKLIPKINMFAQTNFKLVIYTRDWHPRNHISFHENLKDWELHPSSKIREKDLAKTFEEVILVNTKGDSYKQMLWPTHCVQHTNGSLFPDCLQIPEGALILDKGTVVDIDCYSAFGLCDQRADTGLHEILTKNGIANVLVCGVATDWCVAATCRDASTLKYNVMLIKDLCCGIDPDAITNTYCELQEKYHVRLTTSHEVRLNMPFDFI
ncbi:hypothetical protein Ciccas_004477 [Cichlidogyrus casuarinus]|uniref:nicotinamidase n=1 Tax=Cichlidogyrus casuarinus TaxID=1844966 RepID=A0ABD2QBG1_9PLAT